MLSALLHSVLVHHGTAAAESRVSIDPQLPVANGPAAPAETSPAGLEAGAAVETHGEEQPRPGSKLQRWVHRSAIFLFVLLSATAGVLLVILPWTPEWTDNYLLLSFPWLRTFFSSGFFRGLCSGLGLLDIWIGFGEAFHYHERS
jgi:hypothetical protein